VPDEETSGFNMGNYLLEMVHIRGVIEGEPLHRVWNDVKIALKRAGVWTKVPKLTLIANLNSGPFKNKEWLRLKSEGYMIFLNRLQKDPEFLDSNYDNLCFDRNLDSRLHHETDELLQMNCWKEHTTAAKVGKEIKHKGK